MKKIFIAVMAMAAVTFTACNNAPKADVETEVTDSLTVEEATANVEEAIDNLADAIHAENAEEVESILQKMTDEIAKLKEEGKVEEAKEYLAKVQQYIVENELKINSLAENTPAIKSVVSAVKAIPSEAIDAATAATEKAKDAANEAVEATKEGVSEAAKATKEGVSEAAKATKEGVSEAAKATKEGVSEAVKESKKAVQDKLGL